jgi:hypothetical protein
VIKKKAYALHLTNQKSCRILLYNIQDIHNENRYPNNGLGSLLANMGMKLFAFGNHRYKGILITGSSHLRHRHRSESAKTSRAEGKIPAGTNYFHTN